LLVGQRFLAIPTAGIYEASKHAVMGLTKTAAVEYGKHGIRVNAVSPGAVRTQMIQPPEMGSVVVVPQVGGLHHRYERHAA
jgi:NAD(P)-dependent dehydrogenase (short-subunit alcohol dehydrogenase family)